MLKNILRSKLLNLNNLTFVKKLSTNSNNARIISNNFKNSTPLFQNELKALKIMWPNLKNDILDFIRNEKLDSAQINHIDRMLEYNNVLFGNLFRGTLLAYSYKTLAKNYSQKDLKKVHALSWAIEMIHISMLMQDDMCDNGTMRRGQPCWHTLEDVGLSAINDSMFLFGIGFYFVEKYFENPEIILKLFNRATLKVSLGQILDMKASNLNISEFNYEMYRRIAENKTSSFSLALPMQLALVLAGYKNFEGLQQVQDAMLKIGVVAQVGNDFKDLFGRKNGTDIQENKCTWFAVYAYENATEVQRRTLKDCYGNKEPEKVARVKEIFDDLNVQNAYNIYVEKQMKSIVNDFQKISDLPREQLSQIVQYLFGTFQLH